MIPLKVMIIPKQVEKLYSRFQDVRRLCGNNGQNNRLSLGGFFRKIRAKAVIRVGKFGLFSLFKYILLLFFICEVRATPEKLTLPRFASLRSHKVNIHVGPGSDFPTTWTFQRQGLPIEIIAEFDTWRQIRDMEGTTGWVHKSLLVGKRTVVVLSEKKQQEVVEEEKTSGIKKGSKAAPVKGKAAPVQTNPTPATKEERIAPAEKQSIRRSAAVDAAVVAYVEPGVVAKLKQCKGSWCRVDIKGYDGWIHRTNIWGTYPHEEKF